jgi:hypothetical protein
MIYLFESESVRGLSHLCKRRQKVARFDYLGHGCLRQKAVGRQVTLKSSEVWNSSLMAEKVNYYKGENITKGNKKEEKRIKGVRKECRMKI